MNSRQEIRVMIVEDHILIRIGLMKMTEIEPDIRIVAQVEDGESAVSAYREHHPDVVLMDLRLPGMDGIEAIKTLRKEFGRVAVIVLSSYNSDGDIARVLEVSASGYLLKEMSVAQVVEAIRTVHTGKRYFPTEIASRLPEQLTQPKLTSREVDILQMIADGKSNKEIGNLLGIVEGTVKGHVTSLMSKLGASDRTQAVTTALKRGLIQLS